MMLRDTKLLNVLRRFIGWSPGRYRLMAEAKDAGGHFFSVYECRGGNESEARANLVAYLEQANATLVEVAEQTKATVPFPKDIKVVRLSAHVYFGQAGSDIVPGKVR